MYGAFLIDLLGVANREERLQLLESVLELPRPLLKFVRVPWDLTPGPLQTEKLDPELIAKGLIVAKPPKEEGAEEEEEEWVPWDERPPVLADKVRLLFDAKYPEVGDFVTTGVWAAAEVMNYGNFNTYVTTKDLTKQEGLIFRHLLRLILLTQEFEQLTPPGMTAEEWKKELTEISDRLTEICRAVDPTSTEEAIKKRPRRGRGGGRGAREGDRRDRTGIAQARGTDRRGRGRLRGRFAVVLRSAAEGFSGELV